MKCSRCKKNEATVFVKEIANGKGSQYALCSECEEEMGAAAAAFYEKYTKSSEDLFSGFFKSCDAAAKKEERKCTLCGSTMKDISDSGRVGCPVCYSVFEKELIPTLTRLHGNAVHRGKRPYLNSGKESGAKKILRLQEKLLEAIGEENYEEAARLRDEIRRLNNNEEG